MSDQDWIPQPVRAYVYRIMAVLIGLNTIFGWFDESVVATALQVLALFGFTMASVYTPRKTEG